MEFTSAVPESEELAAACGVPLAVACMPFPAAGRVPSPGAHQLEASEVARCVSCAAYVNHLNNFESAGFSCALCGAWNDYTAGMAHLRYASAVARAELPELKGDTFEAACTFPATGAGEGEEGEELEVPVQPVFLALVDATGPPEFLDHVATALTAALEALPPAAKFGLVLFSDKVSLCAPSPVAATLHHVPLLRLGPAPTAVELQDALPLSSLLATLSSSKEEVQAAIEAALRPGAEGSERCAGSALQATLRYLAGRVQPGACRLMLFLSGPPNARRGSVVRVQQKQEEEAAGSRERVGMGDFLDPSFPELSAWQDSPSRQAAPGSPSAAQRAGHGIDLRHAAPRGRPAVDLEVDWSAGEFWEQAGSAAAALGIQGKCMDICAASEGFVGLELMEPLCTRSGGTAVLYPSAQEASLPQDVYKRLSATLATSCLLRLRASPELEALRCHPRGRAVPDEQHAGLYHVAAAAPDTTFMYELRRTAAPLRGTPVVQLVSQFSAVQATDAGGCVLRRWLRVHTLSLPVATSPVALWSSVSPDALVVLMAHLAARAAERRGPEAAKAMLLDWLSLLAAGTSRDGVVDASLGAIDGLQLLPRLAFGLLGSPLLQPAARGQPPDLAAFCHGLMLSLPPAELATALYPRLSSWTDAESVAMTRHSLSKAALAVSNAPLLLLDTYWQLVVLRRASATPELPFPPPQHSALRSAVDSMRQARRITPQVLMLREEEGEAGEVLERALIEDAEGGASYLSLLHLVERQAQVILAEEHDD